MQVRYIKRGLFIMLKFIDIILITIGAYLLMISGIILDMEISCGIENISKSVAIKLNNNVYYCYYMYCWRYYKCI